MDIFTVNQVNQVYVVNGATAEVVSLSKSADIDKAKVGSIGVGTTPDGESVYFKHVGVAGINRTDLIDKNKIAYGTVTYANAMERKLKAIKVTINSEALKSSKPLVGQDYILRLKFAQVSCPSVDNQYWKFGAVHVTTGMTASDFYKKMAISLVRSMNREVVKLVSIWLGNTEVTANTKESDLTGSYNSLTIKEVEQDWILGLKQQHPLNFSVEPSTVKNEGVELFWADVIDSYGQKTTGGVEPVKTVETTNVPDAAGVVKNGKKMADYEYFYMGERGDQYRMVGYPNYIPTKYLVDPSKEYDTIGIHFSYIGDNHSVQKSEKDVTFIVDPTLTSTLVTAIEAATGKTLKVVGTPASTPASTPSGNGGNNS